MKKIVPGSVGIGLRPPHFQEICETAPDLGFLELHSENYFNKHSQNYYYLEQAAERYPLSFHGIGLSLGSYEAVSTQHLDQLKELVDQFQPALVSDHLSWSSLQGNFFNDLIPIPYTQEALQHFVNNVNQVQDHLQRQILIENPSAYLQYKEIDFSEPAFINEIIAQTGCGLILDLNNVYVSATNQNFSVDNYITEIDKTAVQEIHLAGFTQKQVNQQKILIDTHSTHVSDDVWRIYQSYFANNNSDAVTLIEWDLDIPSLATLIEEHNKAKQIKTEYLPQEKLYELT